MGRGACAIGAVVLGCLAPTACGHAGTAKLGPTPFAGDSNWRVVQHFPIVRQTSEVDCGAAALAALLAYWGQPTGVADITKAHPPDPQRGLFARDLRDFARRSPLSVYLLAGTMDDLDNEITAGRPVLVGLVRAEGSHAYGHYAVVTGLRRDGTRVLLADPATGWVDQPVDTFVATWGQARWVTLVVLPGKPVSRRPPARGGNSVCAGEIGAGCQVSVR